MQIEDALILNTSQDMRQGTNGMVPGCIKKHDGSWAVSKVEALEQIMTTDF